MQKVKRRARKPKQTNYRVAEKVTYKGHEFSSKAEMRFFQQLEKDVTVKEINVHPVYQIIDDYEVACKKCLGIGTIRNAKTGNANKCPRCKLGRVTKKGRIYTADFHVIYIDGYEEVFDVKGNLIEKDFPIRKTLFEMKTGIELLIAKYDYNKKRFDIK